MADLELLEGVSSVAAADWNALAAEESPFLEWEWLASLEAAGALGAAAGWLPRPLLGREDGRVVAACPLYVKAHSEGEFVFDFAWAEAAQRAGLAYYPKLLVGVPFTPVTGARFLTHPEVDRTRWVRRMTGAVRELCVREGLSGVHVNFCREDELAALEEEGFLPRLGVQYHWANEGYASFEDYLARLRSKRRNQVRRELRELAAAQVRIETRRGHEIPDSWFPALFRCYCATVDLNPWGRRYLTPRFFELLAERFRPRLCVVTAWCGDQLLGAALNVEKDDGLYGRYWGALHPVRHLHFAVCYYAGIRHCIEHGLRRFEPGAGGEYKQVRGFDAQPTRSAHFLGDARLAQAVARFLESERAETREAIGWLRDRSALKPRPEAPMPRHPGTR